MIASSTRIFRRTTGLLAGRAKVPAAASAAVLGPALAHTALFAPALYQAYGLRISSMIALSTARLIDPADLTAGDAVDLDIELGSPHPHSGVPIVTLPGVARYQVAADGSRITLEPHPQSSSDDLANLLLHQVIPDILWLRDRIVLNASAALFPGDPAAIAFASSVASDRFTLLDDLLTANACIVGDENLALRVRANHVQASGLPYASATDLAALESTPIGAILLLHTARPDQVPSFVRLRNQASLAALLSSRQRPAMAGFPRSESLLLPRFAQLAQTLPIYAWTAPRSAFRFSPQETTLLRQLATKADQAA